jgi:predicted nucleotidyltransferase
MGDMGGLLLRRVFPYGRSDVPVGFHKKQLFAFDMTSPARFPLALFFSGDCCAWMIVFLQCPGKRRYGTMKNDPKKHFGGTPAGHPLFVLAARILKAAGSREAYEVCVFGSAAKGDVEKANDIDFAISGLPPELFFTTMGRVQMALPRQIDLIDLDEDNSFTRYLKDEHELVRIG